MSVFSMRYDSSFSIELISYVVGIKEETVQKVLRTCQQEYNNYVRAEYKRMKI